MTHQTAHPSEPDPPAELVTDNTQLSERQVLLTEAWLSMAAFCVLVGLVSRQDGLALLGVLLLIVSLVAYQWNRQAMRRVTYRRHVEPRRAFIGETVQLSLTVKNRKLLPVGWMRVEDEWPETLHLVGGEEDLLSSSTPQRSTLHNTFSLRWYERVRRRYRILCEQRGYYRLGPARVTSGDIFGMYKS